MAKFEFKKEISFEYVCEVEADTLEEAEAIVNADNVEWYKNDDAMLVSNSVWQYDEDYDEYEMIDNEWLPKV